MVMRYVYTGGDTDGYWVDEPDAPTATTSQAPVANPPTVGPTPLKSLADLGYQGALANAFTQAGINELPDWMSRYAQGNWNYSDLVNDYKTVHGADPNTFATTGKANDILSNMGWTLEGGLNYTGTPLTTRAGIGGEGEGTTEYQSGFGESYKPADSSTWGTADQDFFEQMWMSRKQAPNEGAWEQSIKPALLGIGSIAAMAAGPLSGYGAAAEGGLAAAEGAAGAGAAGGALSSEATMAISDMMLADSIAAGAAAGADVGMGAGTSWLTEMGWPASYGFTPTEIGNYLAGTSGISGLTSLGDMDWGKLVGGLGNSVLGGATQQGQQPIVFNSSSQAPSGGATSPTNATGFNASNPIVPATMPTSSVMSAFADKEDKKDYMKYFSTLF